MLILGASIIFPDGWALYRAPSLFLLLGWGFLGPLNYVTVMQCLSKLSRRWRLTMLREGYALLREMRGLRRWHLSLPRYGRADNRTLCHCSSPHGTRHSDSKGAQFLVGRSRAQLAQPNVQMDFRFAGGDPNRIRALARELVDLQPDIIVVSTTPPIVALQREARTIPIVFVSVVDPVASGIVPQPCSAGFLPADMPQRQWAIWGIPAQSSRPGGHPLRSGQRIHPSHGCDRAGSNLSTVFGANR
jgi:hypothetical protein